MNDDTVSHRLALVASYELVFTDVTLITPPCVGELILSDLVSAITNTN